MTVGLNYVWRDCFALHPQTGKPTAYLMIFHYSRSGGLWPKPIVGVNVSKMPEGEGISCAEVHRRFAMAKRN